MHMSELTAIDHKKTIKDYASDLHTDNLKSDIMCMHFRLDSCFGITKHSQRSYNLDSGTPKGLTPQCIIMSVAMIQHMNWVFFSIPLTIFCYNSEGTGLAIQNTNVDRHLQNMGGHEQLWFSSPNVGLSHMCNIAIKITFKVPLSFCSPFDELISNFGSELISEFLLETLRWR